MLTLIFAIMMIGVFGRMMGFAIRLSWGFLKVLLTLIFLPGIIIAGLALGLIRFAFPVLAVIGLVTHHWDGLGAVLGYITGGSGKIILLCLIACGVLLQMAGRSMKAG